MAPRHVWKGKKMWNWLENIKLNVLGAKIPTNSGMKSHVADFCVIIGPLKLFKWPMPTVPYLVRLNHWQRCSCKSELNMGNFWLVKRQRPHPCIFWKCEMHMSKRERVFILTAPVTSFHTEHVLKSISHASQRHPEPRKSRHTLKLSCEHTTRTHAHTPPTPPPHTHTHTELPQFGRSPTGAHGNSWTSCYPPSERLSSYRALPFMPPPSPRLNVGPKAICGEPSTPQSIQPLTPSYFTTGRCLWPHHLGL